MCIVYVCLCGVCSTMENFHIHSCVANRSIQLWSRYSVYKQPQPRNSTAHATPHRAWICSNMRCDAEKRECQCSFSSFTEKNCICARVESLHLHTVNLARVVENSENVSICDMIRWWCCARIQRLMCLHSFSGCFMIFTVRAQNLYLFSVFSAIEFGLCFFPFYCLFVPLFSFYCIIKAIAKLQSHFIVIRHHIWMVVTRVVYTFQKNFESFRYELRHKHTHTCWVINKVLRRFFSLPSLALVLLHSDFWR